MIIWSGAGILIPLVAILGDDGQNFKMPIEHFAQEDQEWMRRLFDVGISDPSPER